MQNNFITVLGSGASGGVPVIGCKCTICTTNKARLRPSIFLNRDKILLDTSPDIRQQLTSNNIREINKVFVSHKHNDHIIGLWELHVLFKYFNQKIDLYIREDDYNEIYKIFKFCIKKFNLNIIEPNQTELDGFSFQEQKHGDINNLTIRYEDIVYANDISFVLNEDIFHKAKVVFLDCADWTSTYSHIGFDYVDNILKYEPGKVILLNLSHRIDFDMIKTKCKQKFNNLVEPAYDNMKILL